ncbi:MAG: insulinase family protein, partial [Opitutaceae bacterium]|nr:insulinase family protein [Opitutaceae bacterium]
ASPTEPNRFRLAARIGRGTADLPRDQPGLFSLAAALLGRCDFGRQSREELGRLIRVRGVTARVTSDGNQLFVVMEGPTTELPFAFQFLTAFLSDVKLEPSRLTQALSDYAARTNPLIGSIDGFARTEFQVQMNNRDPRFWVTAPAQVASYKFDDIAAWVRTHWLAGPLEIGVAGDFDPAAAVAAAAAGVGTLAPRGAAAIADRERLTLAQKPYRNITLRYGSPEKAAVVYFAWPARHLADTRAARALQLATDALVDRLRVKLREEKGVTYAPAGGVDRAPSQPDFAYAWLKLGFDPALVKKLAERVNKIADELARRGLTEEEFTRLSEPLRTRAAENLRNNDWWLHKVLLRAQTEPAVLDDARTLSTGFADLTRDEVNRAAADVFPIANAYGVGAAPAQEKSKQ